MVFSNEEILDCLKQLKIDAIDISQLSLKKISTAFQKLALVLHPDKAGDKSTAAFQQLHQAYEKLRNHMVQSTESDKGTGVDDFFSDNFESFNFPYENQGSFTVKIEDSLATAWNDSITKHLGIPLIKMNSRSTETDRYWKVKYKHGSNNIELTIHLYMNPKNRTGSKLLVQGSVQSVICAYVFNERNLLLNVISVTSSHPCSK